MNYSSYNYDIPDDASLNVVFDIDINTNKLIGFVDTAHANDLHKHYFTTGLIFTFVGGAVIYKLKTQSITTSSSNKAEFIAAHTAAKIA